MTTQDDTASTLAESVRPDTDQNNELAVAPEAEDRKDEFHLIRGYN
jgi:hypothetical protein